jgi:(4S)-4-hydroxy-5-phosphonooxypentane-2,3-dione isomerase
MHIALVHVHVKPDSVAAFEAATNENAANSRREPGVVRFDVLRQQDDPTRFVLVEVYRDREGAAAHKTTAHYLTWRDTVGALMAEPRVGTTYTNVSPSDPEW